MGKTLSFYLEVFGGQNTVKSKDTFSFQRIQYLWAYYLEVLKRGRAS